MDSHAQVLTDHLPTTAADLTRVLGVHFHEHPTSLCRFVGCEEQELTPRSICDAAVHTSEVAVHHLLDLQVLHTDDAEAIDHLTTELMGEVGTAVGDGTPHLLVSLPLLGPPVGTERGLRDLTAQLCQSFLIPLEEPRVLDDLAIAQGGEGLQSDIDADHGIGCRKDPFLDLDLKTGEPTSGSIPMDDQPLDRSLDGAVLLDPDGPDPVESETIVPDEGKALAGLGEGERIVPIVLLEPRVTGFLSELATTKEGVKRQIDPFADILQDLRVDGAERRTLLLPAGDHGVDVVESEAGSIVVVGFLTSLEDSVVEPETLTQDASHLGPLPLGREQPELEYLDHIRPPLGCSFLTRRIPARSFENLWEGGNSSAGQALLAYALVASPLAPARTCQTPFAFRLMSSQVRFSCRNIYNCLSPLDYE